MTTKIAPAVRILLLIDIFNPQNIEKRRSHLQYHSTGYATLLINDHALLPVRGTIKNLTDLCVGFLLIEPNI